MNSWANEQANKKQGLIQLEEDRRITFFDLCPIITKRLQAGLQALIPGCLGEHEYTTEGPLFSPVLLPFFITTPLFPPAG